ncbi:hypothetical protein ELG88_09900 [Rhizobium leguminosarum]|uniref:hypothetical protein n=1 Tax=Rhizobium leguminosarum TaxID=384 RepID=UPI00103128C2|nr:hypothetical protein [Rhizobium leguminosarum]TAY66571.1 hypothetical protein ELH82_10425 [Rhizobium leguminosarum]TBF35498.1 hypothetical protein ELG88_09900 [Rhizobium leguminosarum]
MVLGATIGIGIGAAVGRMLFDDAVIGITFGASLGGDAAANLKTEDVENGYARAADRRSLGR